MFRPNGLTSTTHTGEGDSHSNDRSDVNKKTKTTTTSNTARGRTPLGATNMNSSNRMSSSQLDADCALSDDEQSNKENVSPASKRRAALGAANTSLVRELIARKNGVSLSSPRRYLNETDLKFLRMSKIDRERVLANHANFREARQALFRADPTWQEKEANYAKVLLDTTLSFAQRRVLTCVVQGQSLFFTGSAGTGKSYLIHKILAALPNNNVSSAGGGGVGVGACETYVTSTTGLTAMALPGGQTIYAWSGFGRITGKETTLELVGRISKSRDTLQRWRSTRTLLIDEVSMLDGEFLQRLHEVAQSVRGNTFPFGGIQLLLCGDFLQLPPVSSTTTSVVSPKLFAFEAPCWSEIILPGRSFELDQVFRQTNMEFIGILEELRRGRCSEEAIQRLKQCEENDLERLERQDGIKPTSLLTLKSEVDTLNQRELTKLTGVTQTFIARDIGVGASMTNLASSCPARVQLDLKVGAQVMLLKNMSVVDGLCNGSRGVVVRFAAATRHPIVRFTNGAEHTITPMTWTATSNGRVTASREQVPLELAWAISIHKSQGITLDRARIHLGRIFEYGHAYVALSRMRSLEGLQLFDFEPTRIKAHPKVLQFYDEMARRQQVEEEERLKQRRLSPNTLRRIQATRTTPMTDEKSARKEGRKRKAEEDLSTNTATDPVQKRLIFHGAKKQRIDEGATADRPCPANAQSSDIPSKSTLLSLPVSLAPSSILSSSLPSVGPQSASAVGASASVRPDQPVPAAVWPIGDKPLMARRALFDTQTTANDTTNTPTMHKNGNVETTQRNQTVTAT